MATHTVVLAEDNALLRQGLASMLKGFDFEVTASVPDGDELILAVQALHPDIVMTDVRMPPDFTDEGLRAATELRRLHPALPVLVLSQYVEPAQATRLFSGDERGLGYLLKDRIADVRMLVGAMRELVAGGTVIDPGVVRQLMGRSRSPLDRLTSRESEILGLMARGHSNQAIADELTVSEATVAKHIRNIYTKLDLPPDSVEHRRVAAVLTFLGGASPG